MDWIVHTLQAHSELAIFITLALGFYFGKLKFHKFSLGIVTSVLLVGVIIGQLNIEISQPLKSVFFLLFLFAIGFKVGPQFFRGLKKDGLPQVWFTIVMLVGILLTIWGCSAIMGYNAGEAAGLLSGSQTISAVIGVADDTINSLNVSAEQKTEMINILPVVYAVTYIFGTAGSAWVLSTFGPKLLGGVKKVTASCKDLERQLGEVLDNQPGIISANRYVVYRCYAVKNSWFYNGKTVKELQDYFQTQNKILFVERIKHDNFIITNIHSNQIIKIDDEIVLSGRREYTIGEENWIGNEVFDPKMLDFSVEVLPVIVHKKGIYGLTVEEISKKEFMEGVSIKSIQRSGINIPVFAKVVIDLGDRIEIVGIKSEVERAGNLIGYVDHPTNASDVVYLCLGIFIGGIIGALTIHLGGVPISLSTSGGALIAGLVFGFYHSKNPSFGNIPEPALWFMNNVGLNMFIAVVGISAGPSFISGLKEIGPMLFIIGVIATSAPLMFGVLIGRYIFHFHPALSLGCTAGSRTTTAALGAVQETIHSETPALGYTITYAVGNTLLIIWGVVIVLLIN